VTLASNTFRPLIVYSHHPVRRFTFPTKKPTACVGPSVSLKFVPKTCTLDAEAKKLACTPAKLVMIKSPGSCTLKYYAAFEWVGKECNINGTSGATTSVTLGGRTFALEPDDAFEPGAPTRLRTRDVTRFEWSAKWQDGVAGLPRETYTLKCVARGAGCTARAIGVAQVGIQRGDQAGQVTGLPENAQLTCYAIAINKHTGAAGRCSQGLDIQTGQLKTVPTAEVILSISGYTLETFGADEQAQFCANYLEASGFSDGEATCTIISILPGSVIITAQIVASNDSTQSFNLIEVLITKLGSGDAPTLTTLIVNLQLAEGPPTIISAEESSSTFDPFSPPPLVPSPPLNVAALYTGGADCEDSGSAAVSWDEPASDGGASVSGYVVACASSDTGATSVVGALLSGTLLTLTDFTVGKTYSCQVFALNAAGASDASSPSPAFTTS
jgi:hypothetical protein